jgi:hypothetical protein
MVSLEEIVATYWQNFTEQRATQTVCQRSTGSSWKRNRLLSERRKHLMHAQIKLEQENFQHEVKMKQMQHQHEMEVFGQIGLRTTLSI